MNADNTITRNYLYVDDCPPHRERKPHVHRQRAQWFTPREWSLLILLGFVLLAVCAR